MDLFGFFVTEQIMCALNETNQIVKDGMLDITDELKRMNDAIKENDVSDVLATGNELLLNIKEALQSIGQEVNIVAPNGTKLKERENTTCPHT